VPPAHKGALQAELDGSGLFIKFFKNEAFLDNSVRITLGTRGAEPAVDRGGHLICPGAWFALRTLTIRPPVRLIRPAETDIMRNLANVRGCPVSFFSEYKKSLKMAEVEEFVDLYFYRPLAYLLVRAIYRTSITPNQITLFSITIGLAAAFCLGTGRRPP